MSDFIKILTHGRRLQSAVKDLSIAELQDVSDKLAGIISKRQEQEQQEQALLREKQEKLESIKQQMADAGLDINDLSDFQPVKSKRAGQKRPVKFVLTDDQGNEHPWTGIGRMPRVYAAALEAGKSLEDYKI